MNGIVGVYSYIDFLDICLRSTMLMQVMDIVFTYSNIQIFIYDRKVFACEMWLLRKPSMMVMGGKEIIY